MAIESKEDQVLSEKNTIKVANRFLLWIPIVQIVLLIAVPEVFADWISLLCLIGIPLLYVQFKCEGNFQRVFKLNPVKLKAFIPLSLIALAIQPLSTLLLMISMGLFGNHMDFLLKDLLNQPSLILFFSMCIVPALGEEFFLRGIVLDLYKPLKWPAQVLTSGFIFGIFHLNLNQFSYSTFIGMVLALAVIVTKSIWSGVWIHFLNNFLCFLEDKFDFSLMNDSIDSPVNWIVTFGLSILSVWLIYKLFTWLNQFYSDQTLVNTLDDEDQKWVIANQCEKRHWQSMFTVSMWVLMVIFIIISTAIIFMAR